MANRIVVDADCYNKVKHHLERIMGMTVYIRDDSMRKHFLKVLMCLEREFFESICKGEVEDES